MEPVKVDPVAGTWNGFIASSGESGLPADEETNNEIAKIRLNIYPDLAFAYTTNFTLRNGSLISTGKGNYIVKANETDRERKYFRYDEEKDILMWESQDLTIEFRRNERVFSASDLSAYNEMMKTRWEEEQRALPTPRPTPVPTHAIAVIHSEGFGYDPTTETAYQTNGDLFIESGKYDSVQVLVRYPDNDVYTLDLGGMGGANYTRKEFKIILSDRVKNQTPGFFIRLDAHEYPAIRTGSAQERIVYTAFTNST